VISFRVKEAAALSVLEQAEYYAESASRSLASRWEQAEDEAFHSLLKMPERGAQCQFRSPSLASLRWIPVPGSPKHLVFYRYSPEQQALLVVHVLHGARNLESLLDEEKAQ
jgi:plasmid stabilization system protein ParE